MEMSVATKGMPAQRKQQHHRRRAHAHGMNDLTRSYSVLDFGFVFFFLFDEFEMTTYVSLFV